MTRSSRNTQQGRRPRPRRKGVTYDGQKTTHQTAGLKGYPAVDIFAKPGTPFLAPEAGRVIRISGHDPRAGSHGAAGVFGWSIYFQGKSGTIYFITHLGTHVNMGSYRGGAVLGTVGDFPGRPDHVHVGVNTGGGGYPGTGDSSQGAGDYGGASTPSGYTPKKVQQQFQAQQVQTVSAPQSPYTPNMPPSTTPPLPEIPGSAPFFEPKDLSEAWQMLSSLPLASPETLRKAQLLGQ